MWQIALYGFLLHLDLSLAKWNREYKREIYYKLHYKTLSTPDMNIFEVLCLKRLAAGPPTAKMWLRTADFDEADHMPISYLSCLLVDQSEESTLRHDDS